MIRIEKKYFKAMFLLSFFSCFAYEQSSISTSKVLVQYEQALTDLIAVHQKFNATKPIDLSPGSEILSTYQRIIQPYLVYIGGYSRIIASEMARNYPYHNDLKNLYTEFSKYQKKVVALSLLFPKEAQSQVLQLFYKDLAGSIVQTCFNIVQNSTYSLTLDDEMLNSANRAYLLAWTASTPGMNIIGVSEGSTFQETITQNMETLFNAAISQVSSQESAAVNSTKPMTDIYQKLTSYYTILQTVYTNAGRTGRAAAMQGLLTGIQAQQEAYDNTQKYFNAANAAAKKARTVIVLDVLNGADVLTQVQTSITEFGAVSTPTNSTSSGALKLYQKAQTACQTAQDVIGEQHCTDQMNDIEQYDIVMRVIQKLWAYYLINQTANNVETFPVFQSFVTPLPSNQYQVSNALSALQHLSSMCTNSTGAISQLIDPSAQGDLGVQSLVSSILQYSQQRAINATSSNQAVFGLRVVLLQDAVQGLDLLVNLCSSMTAAINDTTQVATAMTCAKQLDSLFAKNSDLSQFIPHLPDIFSDTPTWVNLTAQFFVKAGVVTSATKATKQVGKAVISQPKQVSAGDLLTLNTQATAAWTSAGQSISSGNFAVASQDYQKAMLDYKKLYAMTTSAAEQPKVQEYYFLARTMLVACSFASIPQPMGPSATLGSLTNIPASYLATQYQFQIDMSKVGGTFPSFLTASMAAMTTFTSVQQSDIFDLVKAYMVQQLLSDQGYHFNNHFSNYHMTTQTQQSDTVTAALQTVTDFMNNFAGVTLNSVSVSSDSIVSVGLSNFPIPAITPIFASMSTAVSYFSSAQALFAPSSSYISVDGQQYYPGNDASLANLMFENMGYCYASQAQTHIAQATTQMAQLTAQLPATSNSFPKDFSSQFQQIQKDFIRVQALLYAQDSSAYAYFVQAGQTTLAKQTQQAFLQTYPTCIDFMQKCLIGDPFGSEYQLVLSAMNQMYVSWAAELNSKTDQTKISAIYKDIIDLYLTAGNDCTKVSYTQSLYPGFPQYHYMQAAAYFGAVKHQYKQMNETAEVAKLERKINDMYYDGCNENLKLYFHIKKQIKPYVTYQSVTSGTTQKKTFKQLQLDFANLSNDESMDEGEMNAYNSVKSLLIDSAMMYEYLGNYYSELISNKVANTTSSKTAKQQTTDVLNPAILAFLQQQAVIPITAKGLPHLDVGVKQKILAVAMSSAYTTWITSLQSSMDVSDFSKTMADWMNLMFNVVKNTYMQDYLGVTVQGLQKLTPQQAATFLGKQEEAFVQAIQKSASSFQNPASVYVG